MNQKGKKLINNTFLFLIGNIGSKFIQFFLVPLYTYTLTTAQYGVTDIFFTTINFIIPIVSIQVSDGLLRFGLSRENNINDVINSSFRIMLVGTIFSIVCSPLFCLVPELKEWIFYFIIILNLQIYRDLLSIVLKIKDMNKKYAINSIIYTFSLCLFNIIFLVLFGMGLAGYFLSFIIANIISIAYILLMLKSDLKLFIRKRNKLLIKTIALYSLPLVINSISYWITMASDRYMIRTFLELSSVGIYAVACKIPTIITTFSGIFNQAWMISSIDEYENEKNSSFYGEIFNKYVGIIILFCALLILVLKPFMKMYVSSDYYIAWKCTSILIFSTVFSGICAFINGIFYAYKKSINITITTTLGALINIILNFAFIPLMGIMGAAIATLVSWFFIAMLRIISIKKIVAFEVDIKKLVILIICIAMEIVSINLLTSVLAFFINLFIVLIMFYIEKELLMEIIKIMKKKKKILTKKIREKTRRNFDEKNRKRLINKDFTIICSNCVAGVIYHNLGLQFKTPTINMYFEAKDFVKFCKNIDYYISCELVESKIKSDFPIAILGDILLYGVHYKNFIEMKEKWDERKQRINMKNIFFIMTERDGCTYEDLIEFDNLEYKNKIVFTHKEYNEIKCSYYVDGTNNNDDYHKTKSLTDYKYVISGLRYIDDWDYVDWLNKSNGDNI